MPKTLTFQSSSKLERVRKILGSSSDGMEFIGLTWPVKPKNCSL